MVSWITPVDWPKQVNPAISIQKSRNCFFTLLDFIIGMKEYLTWILSHIVLNCNVAQGTQRKTTIESFVNSSMHYTDARKSVKFTYSLRFSQLFKLHQNIYHTNRCDKYEDILVHCTSTNKRESMYF
jgi:hypothetical protein